MADKKAENSVETRVALRADNWAALWVAQTVERRAASWVGRKVVLMAVPSVVQTVAE
jgi:hypothetical protein